MTNLFLLLCIIFHRRLPRWRISVRYLKVEITLWNVAVIVVDVTVVDIWSSPVLNYRYALRGFGTVDGKLKTDLIKESTHRVPMGFVRHLLQDWLQPRFLEIVKKVKKCSNFYQLYDNNNQEKNPAFEESGCLDTTSFASRCKIFDRRTSVRDTRLSWKNLRVQSLELLLIWQARISKH